VAANNSWRNLSSKLGVGDAVIVDCNQFYVTLDIGQPASRISFALEAFNIGFNYARDRLEIRFKARFGRIHHRR
jgi:hypothetical protein